MQVFKYKLKMEVKYLVYKTKQHLYVLLSKLQQLFLLWVKTFDLLEFLKRSSNKSERSAEIMAHVGEEHQLCT